MSGKIKRVASSIIALAMMADVTFPSAQTIITATESDPVSTVVEDEQQDLTETVSNETSDGDYLRGDVDLDGKVTQVDATIILRESLLESTGSNSILEELITEEGKKKFPENYIKMSHCNGDVDSSDGGSKFVQTDATFILRALLESNISGESFISDSTWNRNIENIKEENDMASMNALVHIKDDNGNVNDIYPATKIENVEGLQTALNSKANTSDVTSGLAGKVDKETGKGLSTNDYTTTEKNKLSGIEAEANKTVVDSALSSSSTNPLQNKVINTALGTKQDTLSSAQLAAVNSGIDSSKVSQISTNQTNISSVADRVSDCESDIATQTARIDNIASLPSGSTSGDAELMDIRVKADGTTASSAGDAVRDQISGLNNDIHDITEPSKNLFNVKEIILNKNAAGVYATNRAVSAAMYVGNNAATIKAEFLPSNLKYDVEWYSTEELSSHVRGSSWITSTDTIYSYSEGYPYVRILFAKVDGTDVTESDFNGLKLQVELGKKATEYVNYTTAIDTTVRTDFEQFKDSIVFASASDNILNTSVYTEDFRLSDDAPYFVPNTTNAKIAYPVYIGGASAIYMTSEATTQYTRWCVFTKDLSMTPESVVKVSSGLGTNNNYGLIDDIPADAMYAFVTLTNGAVSGDWTKDTIAYGNKKTTDAFKYGDIVSINDVIINGKIKDSKYDLVCINEENELNRKFVPLTVGSSSDGVSFTNQYNRFNLLFFTDSHVDFRNAYESLDNVKRTIEYVNTQTYSISAVVHGGDIVTNSGRNTKSSTKSLAAKFFDVVKTSESPFLFAKGNHDLNDWNNTPANAFTDSDWADMIYDFTDEKFNIVRQTKSNSQESTWFYKDFDDFKIRIIVVDVQDTNKTPADGDGNVKYYGGNSWYISNEQFNWIASTALNFDNKAEKDWGVIIVSHQTYNHSGTWYSTTNDNPYESAIEKLKDLLVAFNTQSTYSENYSYSDSFYNLSVSADYSRYASLNKKPALICWLSGHEHYDLIEKKYGINFIRLANGSATNAYSDDRLARTVGTCTQNLFSMISIDTKRKKIFVARYGAGKNCFNINSNAENLEGISYD